MSGPIFLVAAALACITVLAIVKTIAGAIAGNRATDSELAELRGQCDRTADLLSETQLVLDNQAIQLAELQDRLDFAERLLTQARNRDALGPGESKAP